MLNTKFDLYKTEWLDLVFTNRNKSYGAYELRKNSGQYAMRAMAATVAIFASGILLIKVWPKAEKAEPPKYYTTVVEIHKYVPPAKPKEERIHEAVKPAKPEAPKVNVHMDKFLVPTPTNQIVPDVPLKGQTEITNPGPIDNKGNSEPTKAIIDSQPSAAGTPGGGGDPVDTKKIYDGVDVMPEPAGGMAGWNKFLQRNLRYPDTEAQGKVFITFVIERDGKISNITLSKGVENLLDEEALRVLKIAPAWKPGMQGGQPVRVRYTLPINFQMN